MNCRELFINEKDVLIVGKKLACIVGLNEAIVLNQVAYWLRKNEELGKNFIDGRYWVFNTYKNWQENNFPFISVETVTSFTGALRAGGAVGVNDGKRSLWGAGSP